MNYKLKYLKYKTKYLNLQMKGGGELSDFVLADLNSSHNRFSINNNNNNLEIIDLLYNNGYVFNLDLNNFNILGDIKKKQYYAFDKLGNSINSTMPSADTIKNIFQKINIDNLLYSKINFQKIIEKKGCYNPYNFDKIQEKIIELNSKMSLKCKELKLVLNYYNKLTGEVTVFSKSENLNNNYLTLCIYYKNNCISSITLKIKNFIVEYESATDVFYQNKKYNKLLGCIAIILCSELICNDSESYDKITNIFGITINPISAWILISNFETDIYDMEDNKVELDKTDLKSLYKQIFEKELPLLYVYAPLNTNNILKANNGVNFLLDKINNDGIICL